MALSVTARLAALTMVLLVPGIHAAGPQMTVYKTATCGCCGKWVDHMKAAGFDVTVNNVPSTAPYRQKYGVPERMMSCHTAVVNDYAIEGHVPALDVAKLLKSKSKVRGIAVPGMPVGSPGMEQGGRQDAYSVFSFDDKGEAAIVARYPAK